MKKQQTTSFNRSYTKIALHVVLYGFCVTVRFFQDEQKVGQRAKNHFLQLSQREAEKQHHVTRYAVRK